MQASATKEDLVDQRRANADTDLEFAQVSRSTCDQASRASRQATSEGASRLSCGLNLARLLGEHLHSHDAHDRVTADQIEDKIVWVSLPTSDDAPRLERQHERLYRKIDAVRSICQPSLADSDRNALEAGGTLPAGSRWHALLHHQESVDLIEAMAMQVLAESEEGSQLRVLD